MASTLDSSSHATLSHALLPIFKSNACIAAMGPLPADDEFGGRLRSNREATLVSAKCFGNGHDARSAGRCFGRDLAQSNR